MVDIRAQTDWFGDMYTHLELDRDTNSPMGKWQNNRPITNYTRNEIMEKYNVLGFYNVEHEIFNDNSRFRLVARETMLVNEHQVWFTLELKMRPISVKIRNPLHF